MWAEVPSGHGEVFVRILCVFTGGDVPGDGKYIGTAQLLDGTVCHYYALEEREVEVLKDE